MHKYAYTKQFSKGSGMSLKDFYEFCDSYIQLVTIDNKVIDQGILPDNIAKKLKVVKLEGRQNDSPYYTYLVAKVNLSSDDLENFTNLKSKKVSNLNDFNKKAKKGESFYIWDEANKSIWNHYPKDADIFKVNGDNLIYTYQPSPYNDKTEDIIIDFDTMTLIANSDYKRAPLKYR